MDYCRRQTSRQTEKDSRRSDTELWTTAEDRQADIAKTAGGQTQTELWTTAEPEKQTDRQSKDNRKTDTELRATAEDRAKTAEGQAQTELWTTEANVQTTFQS